MISPLNLQLLVEDAKRQAYRNVGDLVLTNRQAIFGPSMTLTNLLPEPDTIPNLLLQQPDFSVANQGTRTSSILNCQHTMKFVEIRFSPTFP